MSTRGTASPIVNKREKVTQAIKSYLEREPIPDDHSVVSVKLADFSLLLNIDEEKAISQVDDDYSINDKGEETRRLSHGPSMWSNVRFCLGVLELYAKRNMDLWVIEKFDPLLWNNNCFCMNVVDLISDNPKLDYRIMKNFSEEVWLDPLFHRFTVLLISTNRGESRRRNVRKEVFSYIAGIVPPSAWNVSAACLWYLSVRKDFEDPESVMQKIPKEKWSNSQFCLDAMQILGKENDDNIVIENISGNLWSQKDFCRELLRKIDWTRYPDILSKIPDTNWTNREFCLDIAQSLKEENVTRIFDKFSRFLWMEPLFSLKMIELNQDAMEWVPRKLKKNRVFLANARFANSRDIPISPEQVISPGQLISPGQEDIPELFPVSQTDVSEFGYFSNLLHSILEEIQK